MRTMSSQKRAEDPVAIILTSYLQEVRLAAFELVHADLKDVRLVRTGKANPKADLNRNRFVSGYVKDEDFARISASYLTGLEKELVEKREASKEYDWHGKGWEWVPSAPAVESLVAGFAAGLTDYRANSQIDLDSDSKNTRDLKGLRQLHINKALADLKAARGLEVDSYVRPPALAGTQGTYREVGATADRKSLAYLTADFSGKNLKSVAALGDLSPQIRTLLLQNNK